MNEVIELKKLGGPRLTKAKEDQNDKIETCIELLSNMRDVLDSNLLVNLDILEEKKQQTKNDKEFRYSWAKAKRNDFIMGSAVLSIAGIALYLDYFRGWPVIKWLTSLLGEAYGYFI